ncbi:hypothetical protein [Halococcus sp. IIIV-5B]|uniref:hypothetical protein n=1 Tax=Halococcus sp. IIIV-5B TaxID=2321230 RepID=UPI000E771273|nr:hypothetical protein [Halococcus sp. IIIV-5B]RJT07891.1 hypothetical protein D3261_00595 [Halococcus sp. IIIV-5B]
MNARQVTVDTARNSYRNLVGTIVVSLLVSLSVLPLATMLFIGAPLAILAGLWATSLLLGVVLVGAFRFATTVAERGVPVSVWSDVRAGIAGPRTGFTLGAVTFLVTLVSVTIVSVVPSALAPFATGVAAFLIVDWYLVVGFASPEIAEGVPLRTAIHASFTRLLDAPSAVALFLFLSFACALVAGVTVVTIGLFLPGILCLLSTHITAAIDAEHEPV